MCEIRVYIFELIAGESVVKSAYGYFALVLGLPFHINLFSCRYFLVS